jgi:hypothetical protein
LFFIYLISSQSASLLALARPQVVFAWGRFDGDRFASPNKKEE